MNLPHHLIRSHLQTQTGCAMLGDTTSRRWASWKADSRARDGRQSVRDAAGASSRRARLAVLACAAVVAVLWFTPDLWRGGGPLARFASGAGNGGIHRGEFASAGGGFKFDEGSCLSYAVDKLYDDPSFGTPASGCEAHACHCKYMRAAEEPTRADLRHDNPDPRWAVPRLRRVQGPFTPQAMAAMRREGAPVVLTGPGLAASYDASPPPSAVGPAAAAATPAQREAYARYRSAWNVGAHALFADASDAYLAMASPYWDDRFVPITGVTSQRVAPWRDYRGAPMSHVPVKRLLDYLSLPPVPRGSRRQALAEPLRDHYFCYVHEATGVYPAAPYNTIPGGDHGAPSYRAAVAAYLEYMWTWMPQEWRRDFFGPGADGGNFDLHVGAAGSTSRIHGDPPGTGELFMAVLNGTKRVLVGEPAPGVDRLVDPFQPLDEQEARWPGVFASMTTQRGLAVADVHGGDLLWIPDGSWYHAVYHTEDTFAMPAQRGAEAEQGVGWN